MANVLQLKRSATAGKVPATTDFVLGALAINTNDGRLFSKKNDGADSVVEFLNTDSSFKPNVVVATTANIALSGTQTIDGVAVVANDRVLVKNQTAPAENGIYLCQASAWTRATDMDNTVDCSAAIVGVDRGTVGAGLVYMNGWKATNTLGTTAMSWSAMGGGVSLSGTNTWTATNVFEVNTFFGTSGGSTARFITVRSAAGFDRSLYFDSGSLSRWVLRATSATESGSNAGSNLSIRRYDDAGTYIDDPLSIDRASGLVTIPRLNVSSYISSGINIGTNDASYVSLDINGSAAFGRMLRYQTAGVTRWEVGADNAAESGSNAGSNYDLNRYSDAGSYVDTPFSINRATGAIYMPFIDPASSFGISSSTSSFVKLNAATGSQRMFQFQTAASNRWLFGTDNSAEAGADAGCDFHMYSYTDAGTFKETVLRVSRATGITNLKQLTLDTDLQVLQGGTGVSTLTGIVKGNGTSAFSAAVAGTDYADIATANVFTANQEIKSTDAGAGVGPALFLFRDSASPAASDVLGGVFFRGRSSTAVQRDYAAIYVLLTDPTNASEDGDLVFQTSVNGVNNDRFRITGDGLLRSRNNASANAGSVVAKHWIYLAANYTLTSSTAVQKLFNSSTNGTLTLPTGVYEFEMLLYITSMSATSGNATISFSSGGTAVFDRILQSTFGADTTTPLVPVAQQGSLSNTAGILPAVASNGQGLSATIRGVFRVTTAGTIIPSIQLTTAAAAIVQTGSYFKCNKLGETTESFVGAWT